MRYITDINSGWEFSKEGKWERVSLPHSWNSVDGMDGGNDYYRGQCIYRRTILKSELPESQEHFLEINGANSSAVVSLNGKKLMSHDGGYSTFRVRLSDDLKDENTLEIAVVKHGLSPDSRLHILRRPI